MTHSMKPTVEAVAALNALNDHLIEAQTKIIDALQSLDAPLPGFDLDVPDPRGECVLALNSLNGVLRHSRVAAESAGAKLNNSPAPDWELLRAARENR